MLEEEAGVPGERALKGLWKGQRACETSAEGAASFQEVEEVASSELGVWVPPFQGLEELEEVPVVLCQG